MAMVYGEQAGVAMIERLHTGKWILSMESACHSGTLGGISQGYQAFACFPTTSG